MSSLNEGWERAIAEPDLSPFEPTRWIFPTPEERMDYADAFVELHRAARDAGVASIRMQSSGQPAPADLRALAASLRLHFE